MPINPADGPILGTLYGSDAMRAVFDEAEYFQRNDGQYARHDIEDKPADKCSE